MTEENQERRLRRFDRAFFRLRQKARIWKGLVATHPHDIWTIGAGKWDKSAKDTSFPGMKPMRTMFRKQAGNGLVASQSENKTSLSSHRRSIESVGKTTPQVLKK